MSALRLFFVCLCEKKLDCRKSLMFVDDRGIINNKASVANKLSNDKIFAIDCVV